MDREKAELAMENVMNEADRVVREQYNTPSLLMSWGRLPSVFEFNLYEPHWHGWARWELRKLDYVNYRIAHCSTLHSGWVRRPRNSNYLVVRSYDSAGLPWNVPRRHVVDQMESALSFYANADNYKWSPGRERKRGVIQAEDKGQRARDVLAALWRAS